MAATHRILPGAGAPQRARGLRWTPYLFMLPYLAVFVLFRLGPSLVGLAASFTRWDLVAAPQWVGLANYGALLRDPRLLAALLNTLLFTGLAVPLLVIMGLLLAVFLNQPRRGRALGRIAVFAPYVVMSTVVGILWTWILEKDYGLLNVYLGGMGLPKIGWLVDGRVALYGIVIATVWWTVGYGLVLFLAGLQDIPPQLYEAAHLDGASGLRSFRHITVPLLAPTIFVVFLLAVINSFQVFDLVYVMTAGGPGMSTLTLVQLLYFIGFQSFRMGYAAAIASFIFLVLIVFTLVLARSFQNGLKGANT